MSSPATKAVVRDLGDRWVIENASFGISLSLNEQGVPILSHLRGNSLPDVDWASGCPLGPVIEVNGETYDLDSGGLSFLGAEVDDEGPELRLNYRCPTGLRVSHHLKPSPEKAVLTFWTTLTNESESDIEGITRFDVFNLNVSVSEAEPLVAYLLGWLDGPRADAPGRHAIPYPYPSWIPRLLYGDDAPPPPPPPPGGWASPALRLITERLTQLPLRSGKRSTYDNHPWLTVLDPGRGAGFYGALEWSGTWRMDVAHDAERRAVSMYACTDGNVHTLRPGESLTSPKAFVGLFAGDWDDGFNACRRYVRDEVLPQTADTYLPVRYNIGCPRYPRLGPELLYATIDAAADLGIENFTIDAMWWDASADDYEFSIGLGDFTESRKKFPMGLRAVSDYVHQKGMTFGLWFEFERVDLRTANVGRNPWSPSWLLYQKGHSYRSWCQHVYLMCLGIEEAAEWALENMAWAIKEYGVEWVKIDSNEWAVCDDPTHDHGVTDGEWAQVQGMYHILGGLRERFPNLIIENCAGGSQRADLGIARFCRPVQTHDRNHPSVLERRYAHGLSCIYPSYCALLSLGGRFSDRTAQQLQWRALGRMMGSFTTGLELTRMTPENRDVLRELIGTYKKLRPTLHGDRYVLDGPAVAMEPKLTEAGNWEAYEYVSADGDLVSVFTFRCMSPEREHRVVLRGLDAEATYQAKSHSGQFGQTYAGGDLMRDGLVCRLERQLSADVLVLTRL